MSDRLRWGILGTGNIARQFAAGLAASERGVLAAVGSRNADLAQRFAETHRTGPVLVGDYDSVLASPEVDAIYVSLPNSLHHEWTIRSLKAGKYVLCEKPFAVTEAQGEEMFAAARSAGRIAVEAFMYRSHPQTLAALDKIRTGAIGTVRLIRTSFCFKTNKIDGNIRFDPALAGGGVMDVGCYCVSFARTVVGEEPSGIYAIGNLHPSGVDEFAAVTLTFPGGEIATFQCGMTVQADNAAFVCGTDGYLQIPVPWKPSVEGSQFTIARQTPPLMDGNTRPSTPPRETIEIPGGRNLYAYEADDFAATVAGEKPPAVSPDDTLGNLRVLDEIRRQLGLTY